LTRAALIRSYAVSIVADILECTEDELAADESKDTATTLAATRAN
jgi:hypothetical protein